MIKVKGHSDLRRTSSGAIVNVNHEKLAKVRQRLQKEKEKDQELSELRKEMDELRQLVRALTDGE